MPESQNGRLVSDPFWSPVLFSEDGLRAAGQRSQNAGCNGGSMERAFKIRHREQVFNEMSVEERIDSICGVLSGTNERDAFCILALEFGHIGGARAFCTCGVLVPSR